MRHSPTARRLDLADILQDLRLRAGLSPVEAARRLDWDPHKVYRIERGDFVRIRVCDVRSLLDLYGLDDETERERILQIAQESRERGWWSRFRHWASRLPDLEAGAREILTFDALCVPGLLQTRDYAHAVLAAGEFPDLEDRVEARMMRQAILRRDNPPHLHAIVDEAALRKPVGGPEVMRAQLEALAEAAQLPHITVQVLPDAVGAHPAMGGSFTVLRLDGNRQVALLETPIGSTIDTEEVCRYADLHARLAGMALSRERSAMYLASLAASLGCRWGRQDGLPRVAVDEEQLLGAG